MMNPLSVARLIFDTIPQLYEASAGPYPVDIQIDDKISRVFSRVPLSEELIQYLKKATKIWEELRPMTEGEISQIIEREWIQQKFVVSWLESRTKISSWGTILDYTRRLSRRLTENHTMTKTFVIEPGPSPQTERIRLSDPDYFKVFDWLGSSTHTYFRVTEDLRIKAFEALPFANTQELSGFRFYPDFLHPVISSLESSDSVVVHLSENGTFLVADKDGIIASKRELESWTIYDIDHVVDSVAATLKRQLDESAAATQPSCVACSLFQILFDISMKRHGGIILLDEPKNLPAYVVKGIERTSESPLNAIFTHSPFNGLSYSIPEVRKLVELSSIDGALIFDLYGNLVQVGSMILSHPSTPNRFGTREAAAYSAAKNGATAFKVSEDGHMTLFFTTPELTGSEVHRFDFR
jgi:hypothetical protein